MRKRALISIICLLIFNLIWWIFVFEPTQGFAATVSTVGQEFGIATDPSQSFLNMSNMAPGAIPSLIFSG